MGVGYLQALSPNSKPRKPPKSAMEVLKTPPGLRQSCGAGKTKVAQGLCGEVCLGEAMEANPLRIYGVLGLKAASCVHLDLLFLVDVLRPRLRRKNMLIFAGF